MIGKKLKGIAAAVSLGFAAAIFCSCSSGDSSGSSEVSTKTVSYNYSSSNPTFIIDNSTKKVIVNDANGKKLYLAKYNLEKTATSPDNIRVLSSSEGVAAANASLAEEVDVDKNYDGARERPRSLLWAWKPTNTGKSSASRRQNAKALGADKEQISPAAGSTTKDMWVVIQDNSSQMPKDFYLMTFIARAVGDHCIVWAPAESQSEAAQKSQDGSKYRSDITLPDRSAGSATFTDAMATSLKDKFEAAYPYETQMFGDKTAKIFSSQNDNDKTTVDIKKVSDTAAYTNIIVYDFKKSSAEDGAVGYFWNKDYRPNYKTLNGSDPKRYYEYANPDVYYYSNEGNYIYIDIDDIIFDRQDKKTWVEANEKVDGQSVTLACNPDSYLTLCHEYMHSLQFGRKCIEQGFSAWSTALGEILGTMSEDVLAEVLGVPASYSVENFRLASFCNQHYYSSVMDDNAKLDYSILLAFGIYLTRNYGGPALVSDMVKNSDSGDWSCIQAAIKNVTGKSKTEDELMQEFLEQLLYGGSQYTSNKDSAAITVADKEFKSKAVNPRDFSAWFGYELANVKTAYYNQVTKGVATYDATSIINKPNVAGDYTIRARGGFNLHHIGTANSDSVSLVFSDAYSNKAHPKMMLIVGD